MKSAFPFVLTAMLLGAAACGTKGVSIESQDPEATPVRRRPNRITRAELAELRHLNAEEAIQRLRPRWFRLREGGSVTAEQTLSIFVNNSYRGGPSELTRVQVSNVERMDYLNARQSYERWGNQHARGAVLITLRGGN